MENTFSHILVPHNGTVASKKAFNKAAILANSLNSKLTVLTCLEERQIFGLFKTKTSQREFEEERKIVEKEHSNLIDFTRKQNIKADSKIIINSLASRGILDFVESSDVDLIVMSRTKLTTPSMKYNYCSTLESVFRQTSCPLLVLQ